MIRGYVIDERKIDAAQWAQILVWLGAGIFAATIDDTTAQTVAVAGLLSCAVSGMVRKTVIVWAGRPFEVERREDLP